MRKSNPQSAFPVLLIAVFIMVFGGGLFAAIGNLIITELTSTNISSLHSVSSGVYVTPDPTLENCDWRYGMPHKMHWPQLPDFGEFGIDVELTAATLADDFKCTATGPINDIHFWASFASDILPKNGPDSLTFEISIHSDIPAIGNMWSMPGDVLWSKTFVPGEYTVRKITNRPSDWYDPLSQVSLNNNHRLAYQYNFCIDKDPFTQEEGTIYWLSIREIRPSDATHKLGWKTTTKKLRWNDSAVYTVSGAALSLPIYYPKAHEYDGESLNLAFSITDGDQGDRLHDLGDAPDSSNTFPGETMLAYPLTNTVANYPTIFWTSFPPYGPIHWQPAQWFYLGNDVTFESGADYGYDEDINNNLYPPGDLSNRDGADDGLELPLILPHCEQASIPFKVTFVNPTVGAAVYLNLWCDWNRDGDWDDTITCPNGNEAREWAVQNTPITTNFAGTIDLNTPSFRCWHPQTDDEPSPMWLRITISEKQWDPTYTTLIGSGGSGPDEGYEYGETEDYLIFPITDSNSILYDWADSPDSFSSPAYPTISTNNGANHVIAGPWLGDVNDQPDAELNGQPDPNALGDDLDTEPWFSLGAPNDDENGVTIPPLIPGYPADIVLEVSGGGGIVQAWIDYDSDLNWQSDEEVFNGFLPPGSHVISFIVRDDATPGQSFARFRISKDGNLGPDGPALDGEVEDYEVLIEELSPYTKWLQLPDVTPHGIDIQVDSNDGDLRVIADDFECISTEEITDVHFWGSWKNDEKNEILKISLSIYDDDPTGINGFDPYNPYSQPGPDALWTKVFYKGQFKEKLYHEVREPGEWWWDLVNDELIEGADRQVWQIDIDIDPNEAFTQLGTIDDPQIYWLAIRVDTNDGEFGWKTRRWPDHFMDDAVWDVGSELPRLWHELRYPKTHPYHDIERNSVDMAFQLTYQQDLGQPTMRPVSPTQCPAVTTKCPTAVTQCPPINTRCPVVNTQCPAVPTNCAMVTRCPAVSTTCPVAPTQCPPTDTYCPPIDTKCPETQTKCSTTLITVCEGSSETKCPAVDTQCPTEDTRCPPIETECPPIVTRCPPVETQCTPTQCPLETQCPASDTRCPPIDTECPMVETQCPPEQCYETVYPVQTRCPEELTICPTYDTRCPPMETECPPIVTRCPPVETQCTPTQCPLETQCPASETRCPPVDTECPMVETQCPPEQCYETVYPVQTRCPEVSTKCPTYDTRCPVYKTECPVSETSCPVTNTKCPRETTRCPSIDTECPYLATECYFDPTICQVDTIVPGADTICRSVETQCPTEVTICQVVPTQCEPTVCPQIKTQCPYVLSECSVCIDTQYPVCQYDTIVGCIQTIVGCLGANNPSSASVIECPAIEVKCPTIIDKEKLLLRTTK